MDTQQTPLSPELLRHMHAYWRAANDLAVGQISLYDNPLLKEALQLEHVQDQPDAARSGDHLRPVQKRV
jgi:xylulose-5-phosphate/fructose-6-phosphate phosphoketolase